MYNETILKITKEDLKGCDHILIDCRATTHLKNFMEYIRGDYKMWADKNPFNVMDNLVAWRIDDFIQINVTKEKSYDKPQTIFQRIKKFFQGMFSNRKQKESGLCD